MAEQALVADLRIGLNKFDADLKKAMASAEKASSGISRALNKVDNSVKNLPVEFNKLNNSLKNVEQSTNRAAQASERHNAILGRFKGLLGSLGLLVGAQQMLQFANSTIKAADAMTGVEQQLTMLKGNTELARAEMAFIRQETDRLALSTLEGAKAYARIANAAKGTAIEGEGTRRVFTALNELVRANRLSAEQYGNVMNQVTQIISKGRIQTEELVTISEAGVPAFRLLGEAMGVTGKQLAEMLQKGQVSADNILLLADKISQEYSDLAEQAATTIPAKFTQGLNRIKLEFVDLAQGILNSSQLINAIEFDSNIYDIFPDPQIISDTVDNIVKAYTLISETARIVFEGVRDTIIKAFRDVIEYIQGILAPIDNFFKNMTGKVLGFVKENLGIDVAKGVENITSSFGKLATTVADVTTADTGDLLGQFSGEKGKQLLQTLEAAKKKVAEFFGKSTEAPIMLDPIVVKETALKAKDTYEDVLDKLRANASKQAVLVNSKKEEEEAKRASDVIAAMRKKVRRQELEDEERHQKAIRKMQEESQAELRKLIEENDARIAKEAAAAEEMAIKAMATGTPILGDTLTEIEKKRIKEFEDTIDNMKENIQEALADTISSAMRGDLDNIQDVADRITDIFMQAATDIASEFISAMAIDPIVNQMKGALAQLQGVQGAQQAGGIGGAGGTGQMTTGGAIMGGVAGVGAGIGVGFGVSKMAGGGKMGGALGGAAGGAIAGATIGSIIPGIGTLIGAAAGAIIGGIVGGFMAKGKTKDVIAAQTTPGMPAEMKGGAFARSPFGIISIFEEARLSDEAASAATLAISEIDSGIASLLDERQREIVQGYFQTAKFEGSVVASEQMNDAVAKAVQLRFYHALTALAGEETARGIVGEAFSATAGTIQGIQARAMEALGILATIAEFKEGDLSETAQQIKAINEQFQQLADRATVLGLPLDEILAEQQRQLTEVTTTFNQDVTDAILAITDPVAAEFANLERQQKERMQNAIDAGADLVAVEKLNALEREELQKRLGRSATDAGNALQIQLLNRIDQFGRATVSSAGQQLMALEDTFMDLRDELILAGMSVDELTRSYQEQTAEIRKQAQNQVLSALFSITDPFKASMISINQQVAEFQKLVAEGFIPQSTVDAFREAAVNQAREQERQRREQERQQREQEAEQRRQQRDQFYNAVFQFTDPTRAAMLQVNEQIREFRDLVRDGLIPQSTFNQFRRLALASVQVDRALQAISGGGGSPIEQVGDAFKQFIQAGETRSQSVQAMAQLQEQFAGLAESAKILGLSTKDLERSYIAQAKAIREQAIEAINAEMDARREQLGQIDDFLAQLRVSDVLPMNLRFGEARAQFGEAVKGGNVQEAVAASQQYLQIAQEQFGSTQQFFSARNEVERMLTNLRDQQARNIEAERAKAIRQEERQLEQVAIGRSSVDYLRRISNDNSATSRGIEQMIAIAKSQTSEMIQTRQLLLRLAAKIKA